MPPDTGDATSAARAAQASSTRVTASGGMLFRQEALAREGGSENLSELLRVTSTRSWMAAAALGAVLLLVLGWGLFGRLSERVTLNCAFVLAGERHVVASPATGSVTDLYVRTDQVVTAGSALARIWVPDLDRHIELISPSDGTVADHELGVGSVVGVGEPVVWIRDSIETRFEAVVFAPASQSRRLEPGMEATVFRADDTSASAPIRASVALVPERPEPDTRWLRSLGLPEPQHQRLVRLSLAGEADWQVFDGDLCRAGIVVDRKAPVSLLGAGVARSMLGR
ncbi:HlyD family efflux transporter periplasmic adaptor subunit [Candidatus Poriferisodalis sp.]|uniref:HlyD family efflux transporter periplasmic adaptor subunit n=1 Tax=Candidatus Poriferisodalis sp. TaxID=3101277 RepID=UPI003B02DB8A